MTPILVGGGNSLTFTVGIVSTYDAVFLSTTPSVGAAHSSFLVIRPPDTTDVVFEATKNPIDPIEIGIVKQGNKTGRGHKIELINNKDPDVVRQWSEVRQEPEPAVGAGKAEYYIGAFSWPTLTTCVDEGNCTTSYAPEGTTVSIAIGSTVPQAQLGTTSVSPLSPSNCATLDANIASAESAMNAAISANVPKINHYVGGAESVRSLRDEEETTAWSYLQGIAYLQDKQKSLNSKADQIDNFNWKDAGY